GRSVQLGVRYTCLVVQIPWSSVSCWCQGVAGCLTLLQCWIYEYFPGFRPSHFEPPIVGPDEAWASRWIGQPTPGSVADPSVRLAFYRLALDSLTPSDVFWTPFHQRPHQAVRRYLYTRVIRFADIGEFYDPARYLRQFGYRQMVPPPPSRPQRADRPEAPGGYVIRIPESFDAAWDALLSHMVHIDMYSQPWMTYPYETTIDHLDSGIMEMQID
ncbi:unnamed protein product, partial [Linum tenue]